MRLIKKISDTLTEKTSGPVAKKSPYSTGMWSLYDDGLTQSMLSSFLSCPEKARLAYVQGLQSVKANTEALDFGSMMHDCIDAVYTAYNNSSDTAEFLSNVDQKVEDICQDFWDRKFEELGEEGNAFETLNLVHALTSMILPRYFKAWNTDWFDIDWVGLEQIFDVPFEVDGKTIRIRGKWDGVYRDNKRNLRLFETKTKSRINEENISDKLSLDLQVNLYLWAIWKTYGEFPTGVTYNIIRKPGERLKTDERSYAYAERCAVAIDAKPAYYFQRMETDITASEIKEWEQELRQYLRQVISWWEGNFHYKNVVSCTNSFGVCTFLKLCGTNEAGYYKRRKQLFDELVNIPLKDF